jgi:LmbE family N-acetylglucosaminyl deacetylase
MRETPDRALVLAPHTDDAELGCGATIAKLVERGADVHHVAFSICEASVPDKFPKDILATEVEEASQVLGVSLAVHRYPVRHFPKYRQEILEELVQISRRMKSDLVFLPSSYDVHQDHQVIYEEGVRAFKHTCVLGYELPWNNLTFTPSALIHVQQRHVQRKMEALQCYRSQQHRSHWDAVDGLARVRGAHAETGYAEAFQVLRWVIE